MVTTAFYNMATKSGEAQGILDAAGAALVAISQKAEDLAGGAASKFSFDGGALKVFVVNLWSKAKEFVKDQVEKLYDTSKWCKTTTRGNWDKRNIDMYDGLVMSLYEEKA